MVNGEWWWETLTRFGEYGADRLENAVTLFVGLPRHLTQASRLRNDCAFCRTADAVRTGGSRPSPTLMCSSARVKNRPYISREREIRGKKSLAFVLRR